MLINSLRENKKISDPSLAPVRDCKPAGNQRFVFQRFLESQGLKQASAKRKNA
jgi:hypothetical protein